MKMAYGVKIERGLSYFNIIAIYMLQKKTLILQRLFGKMGSRFFQILDLKKQVKIAF